MRQGYVVEVILPREEEWRFPDSGVQAVEELLHELSPYQNRHIGHEELRALATTSLCLTAFDPENRCHTTGIIRMVIRRDAMGRRHGVLHDLVVDPTYRGKGIGLLLMQRAILTAKKDYGLPDVKFIAKPTRVAVGKVARSLRFRAQILQTGEILYELPLR